MVLAIMGIGLIFIVLFYLWAAKNVTRPIAQLESSVVSFAASCRDQKDPEALRIHVPDIRTHNEVQSLAAAVTQMSEAMQEYVKNIALTEGELSRMAVLANKDALTSVRNKNAYNAHTIELQSRMRKGGARFAVLMVDLNDLKQINDTYGHEKGDVYIKRCCRIICQTFEHSAVFRVGGDEFVVIMMGADYENREALLAKARAIFEADAADESLKPWERSSAAIGMAEYDEKRDRTIENIINRADMDMYHVKGQMKHPDDNSEGAAP